MKYLNKAMLLNSPRKDVPQDINENSVLFTLVYCLRYQEKHKENPALFKNIEEHLYKLLEYEKGDVWLRNVLPGDGLKEDQYTSRDQLIAYFIFFKLSGQKATMKKSFRTMIKKLFTYDNVTKKINIKRIIRPRDWIYLGYLAGSKICYLLMPWYYLTALFTVLGASKKHTSGAQLLWLQKKVDSHILSNPFWTIFNDILSDEYASKNWSDEIFKLYYPADHPNNSF